jgi:cell division protein FtsZ
MKALDSPLLNDNKIEGSKNVLLLIISGAEEITIDEIGEINEYIQNETGNNANIIMGVGEDLELGNNISVTVIATGFGDEKQSTLVSTETKKVIYSLDQDHPFEQKILDEEKIEFNISDDISENFNNSVKDSKQKKIDSEINEILRNIEIDYEVLHPEFKEVDNFQTYINDIELNDIEYVIPDEKPSLEIEESKSEISFGLFSNDNFVDSRSEEFSKNIYNNDENQESTESNVNICNNIEDTNTEYIKLDLDQDIEQNTKIVENNNIDDIDNINSDRVEQNNNIFEQPIFSGIDNEDDDNDDENLIRKKNLKKYNYVFKNSNTSIEDLEKIPAYKRMGIEINNLKQMNEGNYSKTVLNEENKLEFPDANTYLHDNVD